MTKAVSVMVLAAALPLVQPAWAQEQPARLLLQQDRSLPNTFPPVAPTIMTGTSIHSNGMGFVVKVGSALGDFFWGDPEVVDFDGSFYGFVASATGDATTSSLPMAALATDGRVLFTTAAAPYRLWEIPADSPTGPANTVAQAGTALPVELAAALGLTDDRFYGNFLSTFSWSDDQPVWRATWDTVPPAGASTFPPNWSLIRGHPQGSGDAAPRVLVAPGQQFPNVPNPVDSSTTVRAYGFTPVGVARTGDNHIVEIYMTRSDGVTANDDSVLVLNGEGLVLAGTLVRERNLIPESIGGLPGEDYRAFKAAHTSASGDHGFRVQSFRPGPPTFNELLFINGELALREGDVLAFKGDDYTLAGGNLDYELVFNDQGDWASNWNTAEGRDVIIVNGAIVAASQVTPVDSDGDGIGDTTFGLMALVIDRLAITDRRADGSVDVLFQAFGTGAQAARQGVYALGIVVAEPVTWTVTATVIAGQGEVDPEAQVVADNGDATVTLIPAPDWLVAGVVGDTCEPADNGDGSWTASAITDDCAIAVEFEPGDRIFANGFEGKG